MFVIKHTNRTPNLNAMAENSEQRHNEERDIKLNFVVCSDESNYDIKEENICHNKHRYSRHDLLSLRNEQISQYHPECAQRTDLQILSIWTCRLRCELQYLGLWKLPSTGNQCGNCGSNCQSYSCTDSQPYSSTGGGNAETSNVQQPNVIMNTSPTLCNKRAVRSRERFLTHQRCINTELIRSTSPEEVSFHNSSHQGIKTNIDHRSISSSHLMPAFAKRRMGNVNSPDSRNYDNTDQLGNTDDHETWKIRKDLYKADDHYNYKASIPSNRINKTQEKMDNLDKISSDYMLSKQNKTISAGVNKKLLSERRIGSGRLVPRDVAMLDVEKNIQKSTTPTKETAEINIVAENLNQKNSATRFSDSRNQDRRLYDLRVSNLEKTEINEDERRDLDKNTKHYEQTQQPLTSQRSMSFRRREYDQRDFREFREQKDLRERREIRKPKAHHRDNNEEPEWFSEGPKSQHDTIELRGFEELDDTTLQGKKSESSLSPNNSNLNLNFNENSDISKESLNVTNKIIDLDKDIIDDEGGNNENKNNDEKFGSNATELFFDNFLNMEALENSIICDQDQTTKEGSSSRFSRWFSNNSNNATNSSEEIMPSIKDEQKSNKVSGLSVQELEASMRKMDTSIGEKKINEQTQTTDKPLKDVEAFRKLLDQLGKPQVDISMKIILPQTGPQITLPNSISVLPSGVMSNTLNESNMMHQQQLLQQQQQNLMAQLSPQRKERAIENMPPSSEHPNLMSLVLGQQHHQNRLDVQHLMQSLARGEVSLNLLDRELNKLNKEDSCPEMPTFGNILTSSHETSNVNEERMQSEQNAHAVHSHREASSTHIPIPRDPHNQAIMDKRMEVEHHETIRRRQHELNKPIELEAKNQQHLHGRHTYSPTPLAFTPTSVLRKMTAERDHQQQATTLNQQSAMQQNLKITSQQIRNQQLPYQQLNQPRRIVGGGNNQVSQHQQQQQQAAAGIPQISSSQQKWSQNSSMMSNHPITFYANKPMGRPILKGPVPTALHSNPINQHQHNQHQQMPKYPTQQQPRQIVGQQFPLHLLQHHSAASHQNTQQHQQLYQQQQQRPTMTHCQQIQQTDVVVNPATLPPSSCHPTNNSSSNLTHQREGGLSPTSNQLAQWFSPELLAQASAGKLPLLNMNQALSLEDFERSIQHSSNASHN